ncbi:MAG: hypothetical protein M9936_28595 [Caldilinea sp.]|nr:hypothetical protein [Caldilinea sp.]
MTTDAQAALANMRKALQGVIEPAVFLMTANEANLILAHVEAQAAEIERLTAALNTCVWALRQPLDDWKGECERKALDEARDALKEQR